MTDKTHRRGVWFRQGGKYGHMDQLLHACINTVLVSEFVNYYSAITPHIRILSAQFRHMLGYCSLSARHMDNKSCGKL